MAEDEGTKKKVSPLTEALEKAREVTAAARQKTAENRKLLAQQFDKRKRLVAKAAPQEVRIVE